MSYNEISKKLDLISNVAIGQKINVKTRTLSSTWTSSLERFWKGESREGLIDFMDQLIEEIPILIRSLGKIDLFLLKCKLKSTSSGVINLINTYNDDDTVKLAVSNFNVKINEFINSIEIRERLLFAKTENVDISSKYIKELEPEESSMASKSLGKPKLHNFKNDIKTI